MRSLYFFGDSICFGQYVPLHLTWVSNIARSLDIEAAVTNVSRNGETTRQALERMPYDVQEHRPDIVYIQFGLNDCNRWDSDLSLNRVQCDAYKANLNEMIIRARHFGVYVVLLATNHPTLKGDQYEADRKRYNQVVLELCAEWHTIEWNDDLMPITTRRVVLVDHDLYWQGMLEAGYDLADYLEDGIHPNYKGHGLYYEFAWPIIQQTVRNI